MHTPCQSKVIFALLTPHIIKTTSLRWHVDIQHVHCAVHPTCLLSIVWNFFTSYSTVKFIWFSVSYYYTHIEQLMGVFLTNWSYILVPYTKWKIAFMWLLDVDFNGLYGLILTPGVYPARKIHSRSLLYLDVYLLWSSWGHNRMRTCWFTWSLSQRKGLVQ